MDDESAVHFVFRNDPRELKSYVHKYVEIKTKERTEHRGYVVTVDPVTGSYVLFRLTSEEKTAEVEVVPGHVVETVLIVPPSDNDDVPLDQVMEKMEQFEIFGTATDRLTAQDKLAYRDKVAAWIRQHLIAVSECKDDPDLLNIMDAVTISPPYGTDNCYSENEVILGKIQGILSSMPADWTGNDQRF